MSTFTFVIDHASGQGVMTYDVARDEWVAYDRHAVTVARVDANTFKTIREFKQWAGEALEEASSA